MHSQIDPSAPVPAEADTAFRKAKIALMSQKDSTFFTTLFLNLKHEWTREVAQFQSNGLEIKYNPEYFLSLSPEQRLTGMLEQTLHTAFLHMERLSDRDKDRWQTASDEVVRNILAERGYTLPPDWKFDKKFRNQSTEQVYHQLPVNTPPPGGGSQNDLAPPPCNNDSGNGDGKPESQEQANQRVKAKVEDMIVQASQAAQMAGDNPGSIPGDIQLFLEKLLTPKLPWHQLLRRWFMAQAKTDYSFRKPNKRFYPDYYLPSLMGDSLVDVMIGVDISGSVSDEDFTQFVSETHRIMKVLKPSAIRFVQFDTRIQQDDTIKSLRDLSKLSFTGRGGTNPRDLLELANKVKPKVLLVFTDGEFNTHNQPEYKGDTLWLIHNNKSFQAPNNLGKVVHYELTN